MVFSEGITNRFKPQKPLPCTLPCGGLEAGHGVSILQEMASLRPQINNIERIVGWYLMTSTEKAQDFLAITNIVDRLKLTHRPTSKRLSEANDYYNNKLKEPERQKLIDIDLNIKKILDKNFNLISWQGGKWKRLSQYEISSYKQELQNLKSKLKELEEINQKKVDENNSKSSAIQINQRGGDHNKMRSGQ